MSEATLTLRELFEVDTKDLSARVEPGLDVYQAVQNARQGDAPKPIAASMSPCGTFSSDA